MPVNPVPDNCSQMMPYLAVEDSMDMFYGDRHGGVKDGHGNCW